MRLVLLSAILMISTALAGCSGDSGPEPEVDPDDEKFDEIQVSDSTGAIRGLVLSQLITPIEGATVLLVGTEQSAVTSIEGTFVFDDLEPGTYFLEASKIGYNKTQTNADVVAGVEKPPIVKMVLPSNPSSLPRAITQAWEGFLQCGAGAAGASTNPCFIADSDNTHVFELQASGTPDWVQVEAVWEGTNAFGDSLGVGIYDPRTTASDFVGADCGSPCWFRVNGTTMEEALGPDFVDFLVRVFPGTNDGEGGSVVIEQGFTIYVTEFHRMSPDEDWLYSENGPHEIPA